MINNPNEVEKVEEEKEQKKKKKEERKKSDATKKRKILDNYDPSRISQNKRTHDYAL